MSKILKPSESSDKILLSAQAANLPEFKALKINDHTSGKKYYENQLKIIYYCYDRDSIYSNLGTKQCFNEVRKDMFPSWSESEFMTELEKEAVQIAIKKLNLLQYTAAERHLKQCEKKFEEFEALYADTSVTHENYAQIAQQLRGSQSLYDVIEKLQERVIKENKAQGVSDYEPTMFENPER